MCVLFWLVALVALRTSAHLPAALRPPEESPSWLLLMLPARAARSRASTSRSRFPNLIDIQKKSFAWLVEPDGGGLRETIDDISPIEDYTGNLAVQFGEFTFDQPVASLDECREKDLTYARPLTVTVGFINRETGEIREQSVFMGDFPWMTERGTFVINGTERVVVTQLVRSPGAYLMEPKDPEKQVFVANLMPARGSWLELEIDKKGRVYVRIDRKRKLPVTVLLRAMGYSHRRGDPQALRRLALHPQHDRRRHRGHALRGGRADRAVQEAASGRAAVGRQRARAAEPAVLRSQALRPHARRSLQAELAPGPGHRPRRAHAHARRHHRAGRASWCSSRTSSASPRSSTRTSRTTPPRRCRRPREAVEEHLDEYEHFGNRRLRTVGELIQEAFRIGLYRMERVVRERLTTEDADTITPQTIINIRPVVAALKEFFGSCSCRQFMDQTNSLSRPDAPPPPELARRRRPDA